MKKKVESPEAKEKRKAKEARELKRWLEVMAKPEPKNYFGILCVVVAVVYIVDEMSTNICSAVSSNITIDLFNIASGDVTSAEYAAAANQMALYSTLVIVFTFVAPFYKALADRYGRKLFLAINTCGMALGMLVVMICPNPITYAIGLGIINFVVPNDVQILYIMEAAPQQHRAKLCTISKACGIMGISLIGIMRNAFLTEDPTSWRMVFLIPTIIAAVVGLACAFFIRETPVFLKERTDYLKQSDEERAQIAQDKKNAEAASQGGVGRAIKFIAKHKQLRNLAICTTIFVAAAVTSNYYNTIMKAHMTEDEITKVVLYYPIIYALITLSSGFYSDKMGRKTTCLLYGTISTVSLLGFILTSKMMNNGIITGIFYGGYVGGLWSAGDNLLMTMPQESSPTELRASVVGVFSLLMMLSAVTSILAVVLQNFFDLGWVCFALTVPFMIVALILIKTKVGETKDIDLNTVTGCEWD